MTTPSSYVRPQSASAPITTNLRRDELAALLTVDRDATGKQMVVATGNSIPIVFGKFAREKGGGVWVTPPAVRYGMQVKEADISRFTFALAISDGQTGSINSADVYQGASAIKDLIDYRVYTSYGMLPSASLINYELTYTTAGTEGTPAIPGTPGTPAEPGTEGTPGYYEETTETEDVVKTGIIVSYSKANVKSVDVSVAFEHRRYSTDAWSPTTISRGSITFGSILNKTEYSDVSSISFSDSVTSGKASLGMSFILDITSYAYTRTTISITYTYDTWVKGTSGTPGTPAIPGTPGTPAEPGEPPVTTALALFAGAGGTFAGMTIMVVTAGYAATADRNAISQQIRCFVRDGIKIDRLDGYKASSDNFADLIWYLLRVSGKVPERLIDKESFIEAKAFTAINELLFNGVIANAVNLRDYISRVAPFYLLRLIQVNGKYALRPVMPIERDRKFNVRPLTPVATFNNSNIVIGTFQKSYVDADQRKPFCALMTWRAQTEATFGTPQITEVRYTGTAVDGPFEQYDLEEFCTSSEHATLVGKYIIASRKHVTHTVAFQTTDIAGTLAPMDIIRVTWSSTAFDGKEIESDYLYQVDAVTSGTNGTVNVEATHFPTTATGASQIAADMYGTI